GFKVVAPYLRGYAPSTVARDGRYDAAALGGDLVALARHFSPTAPARLVGHDWGALAAYAACALAPRAFAQLCTIAVPHLRGLGPRMLRPAQLRRSWYILFFQLPWLPERRIAARDMSFIDELWRSWSPGFAPPAEELAAIKQSFADPAHRDAVLAYYRTAL